MPGGGGRGVAQKGPGGRESAGFQRPGGYRLITGARARRRMQNRASRSARSIPPGLAGFFTGALFLSRRPASNGRGYYAPAAAVAGPFFPRMHRRAGRIELRTIVRFANEIACTSRRVMEVLLYEIARFVVSFGGVWAIFLFVIKFY